MGTFRVASSLLGGVVLAVFCRASLAAEPGSNSNRVTRAVSFQATNALASFQLEPGFRIELVAAEPLVSSPVAMAFDENGRLFVVERRSSADGSDSSAPPGRVRLLQDLDEHGQFLTSTVVAEDLPRPSALACYAGGVFIASVPDILYLKDTSGDGVADVRRVVLSGFGGTDESSAGALLNNFNWGLSDRIYGATAGLGGAISSSNWAGGLISIDDADFSFNPRTQAVIPESGPAESGLSFDSTGRKFVCDFDHPLRLAMYEKRYWARNPFFWKAPELMDVASPATPVFRWSAAGPGRPGGPPTNALATAWLTNAQGLVVYRGNAFPANYSESVFVCDPDGHVVHRFVLSERGLGMVATRPSNERNSEFLLSKDNSFRPVQALNGPDGGLYILDTQDGNEQGRIYRILPERFKANPARLGSARTYDLVSALAHPNGWHRDTAARLLFERQDPAAVPLLSAMLSNSINPVARLQAVYGLSAMGALNEGHVLKLFQDTNAAVRQSAIMLSELLMPNGSAPEGLWSQLKLLGADPSVRVRSQVAFTLGAAQRPEKPLLLAQLLSRDATNEWLQTAVLSSLGEGAGASFRLLANDVRFRSDPSGMAFLIRLAEMIGTKGRLDDVSQAMDFIGRAPLQVFEAYKLTAALGEGLHRTRSSLGLVDSQGMLSPVYASALAVAVDVTAPELLRIEAVRMVRVSPYTYNDTSDWLLLVANPQPLTALRAAAIETLGRYDDPRVVPALLERWAGFTPLLRRQAVMALLARSNRVPAVLAAVENGRISRGDLPSNAMNLLRTFWDGAIAQRANRLLGPVPVRRPELMDQFKPALRLLGSADHGRDLFNANCSGCHQVGGSTQLLGPDLAAARIRGKERLLSSIVEPNANVATANAASVLETEEGELVIGLKAADNPASVTMLSPGALPAVWPRLNVRSLRSQTWSLMPDGLDQGLSTQDMADLLEYLMTGER